MWGAIGIEMPKFEAKRGDFSKIWPKYVSREKLNFESSSKNMLSLFKNPGGYFQIRRSGGLDLTSSLEAKFGARSGQVHKIRGNIWEVLSPKDAKVGKKSQFWGHI